MVKYVNFGWIFALLLIQVTVEVNILGEQNLKKALSRSYLNFKRISETDP
jgi:hypothetical protein